MDGIQARATGGPMVRGAMISVRYLTKRVETSASAVVALSDTDLSVAGLLLNMSVAMVRKRVLFWDPASRQERVKLDKI